MRYSFTAYCDDDNSIVYQSCIVDDTRASMQGLEMSFDTWEKLKGYTCYFNEHKEEEFE